MKINIKIKLNAHHRAQLKGTDGVQAGEKCAFHETKLTHYIHFFRLIYCCFTSGPTENSIHRRRWRALSPNLPPSRGSHVFGIPIYVRFTPYRFLLLLTPTLFTFFSTSFSAYETRKMYRIIPRVEDKKKCFAYHGVGVLWECGHL